MNDFVFWILSLITGVALGFVFFGGLWWTVRKGARSKRPVFWFFGSLIVRTGITLSGFYLISSGHWERMLLCLAGFIIARFTVVWLTKGEKKAHYAGQEINNAP